MTERDPVRAALADEIKRVLESWFGEAIEHMEEPARIRKFLLEPLVKGALNALLPGRLDCCAIDREQIAALLYVTRYPWRTWFMASLDETALAYKQADQIIASLRPIPPTLNSGAVETKLAGSEPLGPLYDGTTMDNQKPDAGPGGSMTTALLPQTGDGDPVRAALADACREAFDSESVSLKNIILRKAHDALRDHLPPTLNSGAVTWGQLVQLFLRAMDTSPRSENAAALAERMATAVIAALPPTLNSGAVEEALKPFAKIADLYDDREDDTFRLVADMDIDAIKLLTLGACRKARAALALPRAVDGGALPQAGPGSGGAGGQSIAGAGVAGIEQPRTYGEYCKNPSDTVAPCSPDLLKAMDYKWQP